MHLLIVGLGNPGTQYKDTWHNLGFKVIDYFHEMYKDSFEITNWNRSEMLQTAQGKINDNIFTLAKPQKFMNLSGQAIKFFLPIVGVTIENLWVIHDEADLALGRLKISRGTSAAGHKGVLSIIESIGNINFVRFRIGIATEPTRQVSLEEYVLDKPRRGENVQVHAAINQTAEAIKFALENGVSETMNRYNRPTEH